MIGLGSKQIENEPVHGLQEAARAIGKVMVTRNVSMHCNQTSHYIAQCPRSANDLLAVVSVDPENCDGQEAYEKQEDPTKNAIGGYSNRQNNPQRTTYCGRGGYSWSNGRNPGPGFGNLNRGGRPRYQENCKLGYIYEDKNVTM